MLLVLSALGIALIGVIVGATSIGGFLIVPLLALVLHMPASAAVGTTLTAFIPASVMGTWLYARRQQVDFVLGVGLAALSIPGILLGTELARQISESRAVVGLSALLIIIGAYIAWQTRRLQKQARIHLRDGATHDHEVVEVPTMFGWRWICATPLRMITLICAATVAGVSNVLAGVGGALVLVPVLVTLGIPPQRTVGTGQLITTLMACVGAYSYIAAGKLSAPATLAAAGLFLVGLMLGAATVRYLNGQYLRVIVSALCFGSAIALLVLM